MTRIASLFVLVFLAGPVAAQSITIPTTVQVDAPGLIVIRATAIDADDARFYPLSPGIQTFPPDVIPPNPKVFLGLALAPGTYKIGVVPAKDVGGKAKIGDAQVCVVTVGTPTPPTPPVPPAPPTPPAALVQAIQTAYTLDKATDASAATNLANLAKVYAYLASSAGIGNVTTVNDWSQAVKAGQDYATSLGVLTTTLPNVQAAVGAAFVTAVPSAASGSGPISAADRAVATAFFSQAAQACGQVMK